MVLRLRRARRRLSLDGGSRAGDALEHALDDLRAAHEELVARSDTIRALRLAANMFPLWEVRDRFVEADRWLDRALELPGHPLAADRGIALDVRSSVADHLVWPDDCKRYAEEAVRILRVAGTPTQLAMAVQGQATSLHDTDPQAAVVLGEEALALARGAHDARTVRTIAFNLGAYVAELGDHDRAQALFEEARALSYGLGEDHFVAACLEALADLELDRHRFDDAWALYIEAAEHPLPEMTRAVVVAGLAACAAGVGQDSVSRRLWAAFERWELKRGARIQRRKRRRYESLLEVSGPTDADQFLAPTLQEALVMARAWSPPSSPL